MENRTSKLTFSKKISHLTSWLATSGLKPADKLSGAFYAGDVKMTVTRGG